MIWHLGPGWLERDIPSQDQPILRESKRLTRLCFSYASCPEPIFSTPPSLWLLHSTRHYSSVLISPGSRYQATRDNLGTLELAELIQPSPFQPCLPCFASSFPWKWKSSCPSSPLILLPPDWLWCFAWSGPAWCEMPRHLGHRNELFLFVFSFQ